MPTHAPPYTLFFTLPVLKTPTPAPRVKYITQTPALPLADRQTAPSQSSEVASQQAIFVFARPVFLASHPFFVTARPFFLAQRSYDVAQHQYGLPQRLYGAAQHQYHEPSQPYDATSRRYKRPLQPYGIALQPYNETQRAYEGHHLSFDITCLRLSTYYLRLGMT